MQSLSGAQPSCTDEICDDEICGLKSKSYNAMMECPKTTATMTSVLSYSEKGDEPVRGETAGQAERVFQPRPTRTQFVSF